MKTKFALTVSAIAMAFATPAIAQDAGEEPPVITTVEEVDLDPSNAKMELALQAVDIYWPQGQAANTVNYVLNDYADRLLDTPIQELAREFGAQEMMELAAVAYEMGEGMDLFGFPGLGGMAGMGEPEAAADEDIEAAVEEDGEEFTAPPEMTPEQMQMAADMMLGALGDKTLREMILEEDEYFNERLAIVRDVMATEFPPVMADSEPRLREVMAELFADRFTESELLELAAFSQTEAGMKLTRTFWTMSLEPSYYRAIIAAMPGFIRGMPRLVEAMETRFAEADLPPMFPEPEPFDEIACSDVEEGDEVDACYDDSWEVAEEAMEAEAVEIETATEEIEMSDEDLAAMYEEWAAEAEAEAADYRARAEELRAGSDD